MKRLIFILLFLYSFLSFGQKIGISYGNSAVTDFFNEISVPKNIIMHYFHPIPFDSNFTTNFSIGYGISNYYQKSDYYNRTDSKNEVLLTGFPIELELTYTKSITQKNDFHFIIGIGIGYYNYTRKYEYYIGTKKFDEEESKIYGFGQYYTFGTSLNIIKNISTFLQIKKLGLSFIKHKSELTTNGEKVGESIQDINTSNNFNEFGIALGVCLNL